MTSNQKKLYSIYARLFEEFKSSDQKCWLEIVKSETQLSINFVHFHKSYESSNKWLAIYEHNPESFERLKNHIVEVLRGKTLIEKGL